MTDRQAYVKALKARLGEECPVTDEWSDAEVRDYVTYLRQTTPSASFDALVTRLVSEGARSCATASAH